MELPTFGVEEEFLLVDPESGEPVAANRLVAQQAEARGLDLQLELTSCQVETTSAVVQSSSELRAELTRLRRIAAESASACNTRLLAAGLPPSVPHQFPITDTPRYRAIADNFGMIAHEQGICGCHVHVAVPDRGAAVHVSNWLRPWLPLLVAVSANSAIYRSTDSGYASWRSVLWARWPSAGPPPYFESVDEYDAVVEMLIDTGAVLDDGMVYWDVRPSSKYPTIEVRAADVPLTVSESVFLATLIRAAVITALDELDGGIPAPRVPAETLRAAYWKAARDGLSGRAIDLAGGYRSAPTRDLLAGFIERVAPALDQLGEHATIRDELNRLLEVGNGAMRQTRAWRQRGEASDVIRE
ncbi:MAG: glutamate---cysteine ligase / carboxylate-amine ligase, partial [Mycobacterium sp.]|nr:glutamate---cysteine ligase / carboxylate-amine ligase [Mycobacterium sp.]